MDVIQSFVSKFHQERNDWEQLKEYAMRICRDGLQNIGVLGNVTGRVKEADTLRIKLEKRNSRKEYPDEESIMNNQMDFVGLRIALYFPDDKHDVIQMLRSGFKDMSFRHFHRSWSPETPDLYQPLFGQYVADHVWVSLKNTDRENAGKHFNCRFEIQLRSVLMDAWSGISHAIAYKAKDDNVSLSEQKLLDMLKGHVEVGEMMLNQIYLATRRRVATQHDPIHRLSDLKEILKEFMPRDQLSESDIGDLTNLLYVLDCIGANTSDEFRNMLKRLDFQRKIHDELDRWSTEHRPVPATMAFYLLKMALPELERQTMQELNQVRDQLEKYQDNELLKSRYWLPLIWLSEEFVMLGSTLTFSEIRKYEQIWLASFYLDTLHNNEWSDKSVVRCLLFTRDNTALGVTFVADLCIYNLAPTSVMHTRENPLDDRFELIARVMIQTYKIYPQAWTKAINDYSLLNTIREDFFRIVNKALIFARLEMESDLAILLRNWPIGTVSNIDDWEEEVNNSLNEMVFY